MLGFFDFFRDISNFLKAGSVLGVDIGTTVIKAIELRERRGRFKLENYGILETKSYLNQPNRVIHSNALKFVEEDVIGLLKILLAEMKPKTKTVVASIPSFAVFVTTIDMPLLSPSETSKAIQFQAHQYIPLPISTVSIEWFKIEEFATQRGERSQRILLIGIPNEIIKKYKIVFGKLGLHLASLEIESFALVRALCKQNEGGVCVFVDFGAESTNIAIAENGVLKYNSQSDYGGVYLTQALSRGLGITVFRAEELKRRRGLLATGGEMELSTLILPFLDVILQEVRHIKDVYERRFSKKVERAVLAGGGAKLFGLEEYFQSQLNLPVAAADTLSEIQHPIVLEPEIRGLNNDLAVAVGLARKYFI